MSCENNNTQSPIMSNSSSLSQNMVAEAFKEVELSESMSDRVVDIPSIPNWLNDKQSQFDSTYQVAEITGENVRFKYLSDIIDVDCLIHSPLTEEQIAAGGMRIYLIKSPMGSGKTHVITQLTNQYNEQGQPVGHMMVYKKNIEDIIEGTKAVEYLELFTEKAIKENIPNVNRYAHIQTYTKRFFDVFAEGLIESGLTSIPEDGYDLDKIIDAYFENKVIFVDECDYIINMLAAFTSTFTGASLQGTKTWDEKYSRLKHAAVEFYRQISMKCKAIILFTATTTSEFFELLPNGSETIDPTDYLDEGEYIKSISIEEVVYIPFYEWDFGGKYDNLLLSDRIIMDVAKRFQWDKALQFSPNIRKRHIQHYLDDYRTGVLAPPHKLNEAAKSLCSPTDEAKTQIAINNHTVADRNRVAKRLGQKTAVIIHISDFDTSDSALVSLHTALNNTFVNDNDVILITGSNARAANITTEYDNVLVITDAPWNAEVIQALGRFRNARIHAYILHRIVSKRSYDARRYAINKTDNEIREEQGISTRKKSDMERHSPKWWRRNSTDIYNYWFDRAVPLENTELEITRIKSLINEIEDFDFTLGNSLSQFTIGVDLTYCSPNFSLTMGKPLEDKKGGKVLSFLQEHPDLSINDAVQKFKELNPDEKISRPTIIKYRKMLKEQQGQ